MALIRMRTGVTLVTTKGTNHYINHMAKPRFDQDANRGYFIEAFETLILEEKKKRKPPNSMVRSGSFQ